MVHYLDLTRTVQYTELYFCSLFCVMKIMMMVTSPHVLNREAQEELMSISITAAAFPPPPPLHPQPPPPPPPPAISSKLSAILYSVHGA